MQAVLNIFAPVFLFTSSLLGFTVPIQNQSLPSEQAPQSVELGLREVSPNGERGGFAIPASGCSATNPNPNPNWGDGTHFDFNATCLSARPTITVDKPIVRMGEMVTISWDPKLNIGCVFSTNMTALTGGLNPNTAPNPMIVSGTAGNPARKVIRSSQTTYSITCDGLLNQDSVTVKVLPRIQET